MSGFEFGESAMEGKKKIYKAKTDAVFKMLFGDPKDKNILSKKYANAKKSPRDFAKRCNKVK